MVERFYKFFGGCMYLCKKRQAHHKDTWRWRINGLGALQSLDKMISYMCKRRQEKYSVVKRDKIGGTSRYAHIQEASRDQDADG